MSGTRAMKAAAAGSGRATTRKRTTTTTKTTGAAAARRTARSRVKEREFTLPGSDEVLHVRPTIKHDAVAMLAADLADAEDADDDRAGSRAVNALLANVFTPETVARIKQRIIDPDDPLGFAEVTKAIRQAMEVAAGRPTTSS